jgi:hypothetical protein
VGKLECKIPLARQRRMWLGNINIDLRQIEWDGKN